MATNLYTNNTNSNVTGTKISGGRSALDVSISNAGTTSFNELKTASRYAQIELKSAIDSVSTLRNTTTTTNASVAVNTSGEYTLSTTAVTNASVLFESGERGRYIPGYEAECGIGVRIPTQTWTGTQYTEWGYFDDNNGVGYGIDSTGPYIFIKRQGVKTKTYQSDWNKDTLDGSNVFDSNPTGSTLDLQNGVISQIDLLWYGYGAIKFFINVKDATTLRGSVPVLVHVILPENDTSISQPNLPISVIVENGDSATSKNVYVGGRQFSIYGRASERYRINGELNTTIAVTNSAWTPLISFKRKTGIGNNQTVALANLDIIPDGNIIYTFVTGAALTGSSFGGFTNVAATETVLEVDTAATAIVGGTFFGGEHLAVGNNQGKLLETLENMDFAFVNSDAVTIVAKSIGASANVEAVTLNAKEQW
jgi:hypothetical protein